MKVHLSSGPAAHILSKQGGQFILDIIREATEDIEKRLQATINEESITPDSLRDLQYAGIRVTRYHIYSYTVERDDSGNWYLIDFGVSKRGMT